MIHLTLLTLAAGLLGVTDPGARCLSDSFVGITHSEPYGDKLGSLGYEIAGGTIVTNVLACSAAEEAGLQPLDYLYAVDGRRAAAPEGFFCLLTGKQPGDEVEVELLRRGEPMRVRLNLGEKNEDCDRDAPFECRGFFGISGVDPDREVGTVLTVSGDGPVAGLGLRTGDRLLRIDGYPIGDWNDLSSVKRVLDDLGNVTFEIVRDGKDLVIAGPIEDQKEYGESEDWNWSWNDGGDSYGLSDDDRQEIREDVREAMDEARESVREARESVREALAEARSELRDTDEERGLTRDILETVGTSLDEAFSDLNWDGDGDDDGDRGRANRGGEPNSVRLESISDKDRSSLRGEDVDLPSSDALTVERLAVATGPGEDKVRLSFGLPERGETTVSIYNEAGREVYSYGLGDFTGAFEDELDLKRNGRGDYFLVIEQGENEAARKIVLD